MIRYGIASTGSCGNAYVFYDGKDAIAVDQGLSFRKFTERVSGFGIPVDAIRRVFLTHLHPDHSLGARTLARRNSIKVSMSDRAARGETAVMQKLAFDEGMVDEMKIGSRAVIGDIAVTSFATSHDSMGSVGYDIECGGYRFVIITDTGRTDETMKEHASAADVLFLESNYDEDMLREGPYPMHLKRRISSDRGHLSNRKAVEFIKDCGFAGKHVYMIHLSRNNNHPDMVRRAVEEGDIQVPVTVCGRGEAVQGVEI